MAHVELTHNQLELIVDVFDKEIEIIDTLVDDAITWNYYNDAEEMSQEMEDLIGLKVELFRTRNQLAPRIRVGSAQ